MRGVTTVARGSRSRNTNILEKYLATFNYYYEGLFYIYTHIINLGGCFVLKC